MDGVCACACVCVCVVIIRRCAEHSVSPSPPLMNSLFCDVKSCLVTPRSHFLTVCLPVCVSHENISSRLYFLKCLLYLTKYSSEIFTKLKVATTFH